MGIKRITVIVPLDVLQSLERSLRACGVPGVTVEHVQGYGEHPNFFRRDLMKENARVLLYTEADRVEDIVAAITQCAAECGLMSGILAIENIERLVKLSDGTDVTASALSTEGAPR